MKKLIICILCCAMGCGIVACGSQAQQKENISLVRVVNVSDEEIYGIGYTYYANGDLLASGGGCNADNSALKVGEVFELENHSFFDETENLEIELSVINKDGIEYACSERIPLEVKNGSLCEIEVKGDYESGFKAFIGTRK